MLISYFHLTISRLHLPTEFSNLFSVDHLSGCGHAVQTLGHDRDRAAFDVGRNINQILYLADPLLIEVLQLLSTKRKIYTNNLWTSATTLLHLGQTQNERCSVSLHGVRQ